MRIKFFGSFHHLVAYASEWGALNLNIPPLMTIIKYKGQNPVYLNQDKYGSKGISYPRSSPKFYILNS